MRQNKLKTQDIVVMYTQQHLTLRQIGKLVDMSAMAVSKRHKAAGVTAHDGEWIKANCGFCGADIERRRSEHRNKFDVYCNMECYAASRESPGFKPWRHGSRIARAIVSQYFKLDQEHIVHHVDGDERNNNLDNLEVYASQSDHIKHHHGKSKVMPLWRGSAA